MADNLKHFQIMLSISKVHAVRVAAAISSEFDIIALNLRSLRECYNSGAISANRARRDAVAIFDRFKWYDTIFTNLCIRYKMRDLDTKLFDAMIGAEVIIRGDARFFELD